MSLPYVVSDHVEFHLLYTGEFIETLDPILQTPIRVFNNYGARPIIPGGDKYERAIDVLLRADPANQAFGDADSPDGAIIYIGDQSRQEFPLRPNESINLRVTRRNQIFYRAGSRDEDGNEGSAPSRPLRLHVVTAVLNVASRDPY